MDQKREPKPLPLDAWDQSLESIIKDMGGRPLNIHSLMAHNPMLLKAWWQFRNYSVTGGSLGTRLCELTILRVAVHMGAWYEWGSHVERSIAAGLTMSEINRVKIGSDDPLWEPNEAILLKAIDELINNHAISKSTENTLRDYYSIAQILDLISLHGLYVTLGCMINTWGLELDAHVQEKLPADVTQESFEGS